MSKLISEEGIIYLNGLREPKKLDPEVRKIAIELPDVPLLCEEDNPQKWDLVFVCSDGIVFAHRLIIANASKYIMHMLEDQPPWLTTYVHVLDLPRFIVQLLVDLAYTGEMRFPEELQNDVFDAMHTLGWVHTDCLSADYDAAGESYVYNQYFKSPKKEDAKSDKGNQKVKGDSPRLSQQDKSPQRLSGVVDQSVDDEAMEISQLPEIDVSDVDENASSKDALTSTVEEKTTSRRAKLTKMIPGTSPAIDNTALLKKSTTQRKTPARVKKSVKDAPDESELSKQSKPLLHTALNKDTCNDATQKRGRKVKEASVVEELVAEKNEALTIIDESSLNDSPTKRQRRKPKRFEEYEELDKPKQRSPSKSIEETKGMSPTPNVAPSSSKEKNAIKSRSTKAVSRGKKASSSSDAPKNNLITSYFSKNNKKKTNSDNPEDVAIDSLDDDMNQNETTEDEEEISFTNDIVNEQEKRDNKRSFDDIRSSHFVEKEKGDIENGEAIAEDADSAEKKPARKSSRVASKAQSTETMCSDKANEDDDEQAPKRKRSRKGSIDDASVCETASPVATRRLSKAQ